MVDLLLAKFDVFCCDQLFLHASIRQSAILLAYV